MPQSPSAFTSFDAAHRPPRRTDGMTFVLASTDSAPFSGRSDVIMLVRLSPGLDAATVVSIPPGSWVAVPGHGMARMGAVSALGGPALMVRTVETLTGVRVDHFAVTDPPGFRALTRAVGGIDRVDPGIADPVERQQETLRMLIAKVVSRGMLSSPSQAQDFAGTVRRYVQVDDLLTSDALQSLAFALRELAPSAVTFVTAPDGERAGRLWEALRQNQIERYLKGRPR
ncbi:LCP family protein [Lentzea nigeriaca]|uniref:LCP family protein n=1 Tax=Lentzea nigeriaca TaxID=1128665 RepID=UPI0019564FD4|nr:LCP family protein [Lentzea nigeriaca]MBM7859166.1 LCP family protein required for cell wall assembly [Lentzea nigeriaca]